MLPTASILSTTCTCIVNLLVVVDILSVFSRNIEVYITPLNRNSIPVLRREYIHILLKDAEVFHTVTPLTGGGTSHILAWEGSEDDGRGME
jgi:hypothetical protein